MPFFNFNSTAVTSVSPPVFSNGFATFTWQTNAPAGTWFQLYVDLDLVWYGTATTATVPIPPGPVQINIFAVGAGEQTTDFSYALTGIDNIAELSWLGGTFESSTIAGFFVYSGLAAGDAVSYAAPVATITAYPGGIYTDGFGYGGFGEGGFGQSAGAYSWTSGALAPGTWNFAVKPFDTAGNLGTAATTSVMIVGPPLEPAPFADSTRLHYTYSPSTHEVTLVWNPSPSA